MNHQRSAIVAPSLSGSERSSSPSTSEDSRSDGLSGSEDGAGSMMGANLARLPPYVAAAVASVQRRIYPAILAGLEGGIIDPGNFASEATSGSEDGQEEGSAVDEYQRLVLELAIIEKLLERKRSSSLDSPVLSDQRAVISAAVAVYQNMQNSQQGAQEPTQHETANDQVEPPILQESNHHHLHGHHQDVQLPQQALQKIPAEEPPPLPQMAPFVLSQFASGDQAQLLAILEGAANLLDSSWVREQIHRPAAKRPRADSDLHSYESY